MRREVRIGLVGCGRAGASLHLPALARVRGARVVALSDVDPARLATAASACPGAAVHADYRVMLDDRVDLVAVLVPVTGHAEIAEAALHAGKHLFVEKPLALELDACDRLVALARGAESSGQRSAIGFNLRSHRLARQARAIVRSGELGEIEIVRTLWTADWSGTTRPAWHASRPQGGGALLEIGTHQADLWRWLLDSEVESVRAETRASAFDDQSATMQARMANGVLVIGAVSQRSAAHNLVEVYGSRGSLELLLLSWGQSDGDTGRRFRYRHVATDPAVARQGGTAPRRRPRRAAGRRFPAVLRAPVGDDRRGAHPRRPAAGLDP